MATGNGWPVCLTFALEKERKKNPLRKFAGLQEMLVRQHTKNVDVRLLHTLVGSQTVLIIKQRHVFSDMKNLVRNSKKFQSSSSFLRRRLLCCMKMKSSSTSTIRNKVGIRINPSYQLSQRAEDKNPISSYQK